MCQMLIASKNDAVAFLRVEVKNFARLMPAGSVVAVKQQSEGIRARAAFEQLRTMPGDEDVITRATM